LNIIFGQNHFEFFFLQGGIDFKSFNSKKLDQSFLCKRLFKKTPTIFLSIKNESFNNDELEDSNDSTQQETQASVKSCDNLKNNKFYNFSQQLENVNESTS
jgi:hypothetical protein